MDQIKRQIARKVSIQAVQDGTYVRQEGWQSNFVETPSGDKVSRINILGTVVSPPADGHFFIDDGTGKAEIRVLDQQLPSLQIGDVIMVVGRPREFGNQIYIMPEIVKTIADPKWIEVRLRELKRDNKIVPKAEDPVEEKPTEKTPLQQIYETIDLLDKGEGVHIEDILQRLGHDQGESLIQKLLREGEIFEIAPGRLKNA